MLFLSPLAFHTLFANLKIYSTDISFLQQSSGRLPCLVVQASMSNLLNNNQSTSMTRVAGK